MHRIKPTLRRLLGRPDVDAGDTPLPMLEEVLQEAERLRPSWGRGLFDLRLAGVPLNAEDDEDDEVDKPLTKKQADKLQKAIATKDRELRESNKANAKLEAKVEDLTEKVEAIDDGGGKGGDGSDDKRLEKLESRVEKAEAKAEEAESKREAAEQRSTAIEVATRLKFRNPKRAINLLDTDDLTDEDSIESALESLATEEPYMVASKKQRTVDDPKPKSKSKAPKKKGKDDEEDEGKSGDDEPKGVARIRAAYEEESEGDGDESGDEAGSDD